MDGHLTKALEIAIGIIILAAGLGYLFQLGSRMDAVMKASIDFHNTDMNYTALRNDASLTGSGTGGIHGSYALSAAGDVVGLDVLYHQLVDLKDMTVWIDSNTVDTLNQWHYKNEGSGVHEGVAVIKQYLEGMTSDRFKRTLVVDGEGRITGMRYTSIP